MNILIAEDDELNRYLNSRLMDGWGYRYDMAANGMEAVEFVRNNPGKYDLCLMDVEMPVMNGIDATRIIRRESKYFPILGHSANPDFEAKCLMVGMDDFVDKLCAPGRLLEKVGLLTVKALRFVAQGNRITVEEEMPMDQQHAQEIRELAKRDLRKVKLFDYPDSAVIVHKNVTNKISHDFNVKKQLLSTFINRDPEKPTRCELYKESKYFMPQTYLTEDEFDALIEAENKELNAYLDLSLKGKED
ncbi:response regulator [Thiohalomonas denitrificans]|uniref:CheY chemotaxis protein or a CheY-like REC (Receiver) domain n=1 Tax=Thiohalomonas denitrificans TaxID=415747 RepID=A0A1G5QA97_9GAMM|nr:response regulator [Thiohalomonas denitrificans]SCZ58506.1 CheY chemotaxis protein or a CheY-like REC (receiver) domain [Thiohalomonas denitrificans]